MSRAATSTLGVHRRPVRMAWPLPMYELALMTAARAYRHGHDGVDHGRHPEDAPLAVFGSAASAAVGELLISAGFVLILRHAARSHRRDRFRCTRRRRVALDRIVALPELFGHPLPVSRSRRPGGFISVDVHCQVRASDRVFAAGDATDFAVKHGSIAAQQADVAARASPLSPGRVEPERFDPVIRGILLGGDKPLYLSAHITGGHGSGSRSATRPLGRRRRRSLPSTCRRTSSRATARRYADAVADDDVPTPAEEIGSLVASARSES